MKRTDLISVTREHYELRCKMLLNRFNILTFISEHGINWPVGVLETETGWTRAEYISCYQGENN